MSRVILVLLVAIVLWIHESESETYSTKYDNIDLDEILNNDRLLKNYVKCLENRGPCTPDGKELRDTLPDAIATNCSKCSERQRYGTTQVTHFLINNKPEDWKNLEKMYDPEGDYRKAYLASKIDSEEENETTEKEKSHETGKMI